MGIQCDFPDLMEQLENKEEYQQAALEISEAWAKDTKLRSRTLVVRNISQADAIWMTENCTIANLTAIRHFSVATPVEDCK